MNLDADLKMTDDDKLMMDVLNLQAKKHLLKLNSTPHQQRFAPAPASVQPSERNFRHTSQPSLGIGEEAQNASTEYAGSTCLQQQQ